MKTLLFAAVTLLGSTMAWGEDMFSRNPPMQQLIHVNKTGHLELLVLHPVCQPVVKVVEMTVEVPTTVNGKVETKLETRAVNVCEMVMTTGLFQTQLNSEGLKAFETDGRGIDVGTLKQRFSRPTLIVLSTDGKMIAPYYANLFKPGTVIIAVTPLGGAGNATVAPPAVPATPVLPGSEGAAAPKPAAPEPAAPSPAAPSPAAPSPAAPSPVPPAVAGPSATPVPGLDLGLGIQLPNSPSPTLVYARVPEPGKINLRAYTEQSFERQVAVRSSNDGRTAAVALRQPQKYTRSEFTQLSLTLVKATTAASNPLTADQLAEKLKKATAVVTFSMPSAIDPFWLTNLKPDVVVLAIPAGAIVGDAASHTQAPAAMPVPAPVTPLPVVPAAAPPPAVNPAE